MLQVDRTMRLRQVPFNQFTLEIRSAWLAAVLLMLAPEIIYQFSLEIDYYSCLWCSESRCLPISSMNSKSSIPDVWHRVLWSSAFITNSNNFFQLSARPLDQSWFLYLLQVKGSLYSYQAKDDCKNSLQTWVSTNLSALFSELSTVLKFEGFRPLERVDLRLNQ